MSRTCLDSYLYSLTQEVFPYFCSHIFFSRSEKLRNFIVSIYVLCILYIYLILYSIFQRSSKVTQTLLQTSPRMVYKNGLGKKIQDNTKLKYLLHVLSSNTWKKRSRICTTVVLQYNLGIIFLFGLCLWCENKVFLLRDMTLISTVKFLSNFIAMLG